VEPDARRVRAAEVVGAVSLATDLGTGQPLEHTLRTAILAVRLGDLAGASPQELRDAYYVSLLHSFGCTSDAPEQPRRSCCARPRRSASAQAVDAVLAAAGHRVERRPRELPAGLTERELEVLLALVAGQTNQRIGESLGISAKTAGHHVQHIYEKAGVRSRAAATVWAFEHSLVHAAEGVRPMRAQVAAPETHPRHRRRAAAPGNKGGRACSRPPRLSRTTTGS
jgi:DNA-binding CsgD family transcriptional regulator